MTVSQPALIELAHLCSAVYDDRASLGFSVAGTQPGQKSEAKWGRNGAWVNRVGFYASVYARTDGSRVLAYRGSDDVWDFLVDDALVAAGGVPPQLLAALEVAGAASIGPGDLVTGHSLGGALALLVGVWKGVPAVSFNAPGVADSCALVAMSQIGRNMLRLMNQCRRGSRVLNVRIEGDPVSSYAVTGDQIGSSSSRIELSAPSCSIFNSVCRHGMATVLAAVERNPAYAKPLQL